jgi:hypothetical protein
MDSTPSRFLLLLGTLGYTYVSSTFALRLPTNEGYNWCCVFSREYSPRTGISQEYSRILFLLVIKHRWTMLKDTSIKTSWNLF